MVLCFKKIQEAEIRSINTRLFSVYLNWTDENPKDIFSLIESVHQNELKSLSLNYKV